VDVYLKKWILGLLDMIVSLGGGMPWAELCHGLSHAAAMD